jgi:excisionase family DNA binding protein
LSLLDRTPGKQREAIVPAKHRPTLAELPDPMSVAEAGRYFGLGENAARRAAAAGEIPAVRIGRRLWVSKRALEERLGITRAAAAIPPPPPPAAGAPELRARLLRLQERLAAVQAELGELLERLTGPAAGSSGNGQRQRQPPGLP